MMRIAKAGVTVSTSAGKSRPGLTLVELLIAISILSMAAVALGMLARATQISAAYVDGHSTAAQHARVSTERILRAVQTSTANERFPGAVLFAETVGGVRFPDTLVVWKPEAGTSAADPAGLPRFCELVVFCPNPSMPNELLEITSRSDLRTVPEPTNPSQWASELSAMKLGNDGRKIVLTDLLRTATASTGSLSRGCARFETILRPSAAELASFRAGTTAWNALSWPQHWFGETTGMRQTWVRWELQLMPNSRAGGAASDSLAIPFPGSSARYYDIVK
jgi:prepilin-type N-terminal cleavage/methylation domain-containing protein